MMRMMTGPAGIVLGISVVTSLAVAFGDKLFPKVEDVNRELEKQRDLLLKLDKITREQRVEQLIAKLGDAVKKRAEAEKEYAIAQAIAAAQPGGFLAEAFLTSQREMIDAQNRVLEIEEKIKSVNEDITEEKRKQARVTIDFDLYFSGFGADAAKQRGYAARDSGRALARNARDQALLRFKESLSGEDAGGDISRIEQNFVNMFGRVSSVFASEMGAAWEKVFGEANSLFEKLLSSMAQSVAQMAGQIGLGYALRAIGGPLGAVGGGILKSVGIDILGSEAGRSIGAGGKEPVKVSGEFKMRGNDLVAVVERNGSRMGSRSRL